ncbi:hypothetical protein PHYSODRAFT_257410 [Phytophthora sojae]|uniref:Uncharacterized protein n=1 Tax=Phytophthora sojae (strain P6497) TaxID=1094619 RepID=G4YGT0_PHYSP|nr:hypothetical protein PHYSODRAFT_257410 [Phytophthora sojae]EGZ27039.1 hypothetical protein PHYSODRAFT_257410 [Phytophthora sojae]|eukprot:XP_009514314.1 hypothetical protein PHYSODRAFT_257410 [Phytophthora sojae]
MRSYSPENYQNFVKESCFTVYMNPWTKDECQSFVDGIGLNEDEWFHRFYLVGGKPRLLFSSSEEFDDLVQRVKDAIPENIDGLKEQVRLFQSQVFDGRMKHTAVEGERSSDGRRPRRGCWDELRALDLERAARMVKMVEV